MALESQTMFNKVKNVYVNRINKTYLKKHGDQKTKIYSVVFF